MRTPLLVILQWHSKSVPEMVPEFFVTALNRDRVASLIDVNSNVVQPDIGTIGEFPAALGGSHQPPGRKNLAGCDDQRQQSR